MKDPVELYLNEMRNFVENINPNITNTLVLTDLISRLNQLIVIITKNKKTFVSANISVDNLTTVLQRLQKKLVLLNQKGVVDISVEKTSIVSFFRRYLDSYLSSRQDAA